MIHHQLLRDEGILIVTPEGPLEKADFEKLASVVDPYIEANGKLNGLMIEAESFPGWSNFAALITHLKFVRDHQQHIEKVAAVTDSGFLSVLPSIADHFVHAEVRHFSYTDKQDALSWLRSVDQ